MIRTKLAIIALAIFLTAPGLDGNGGKHEEGQTSTVKLERGLAGSEMQAIDNVSTAHNKKVSEKFPTFHPLVVHFPIVLIIAAFPFYFVGMLRRRIVFRQLGIIMASFGLLGALLAGYVFHPHTVGLTQAAKNALASHDLFASITLYLTAVTVAVGWLTCMERFQKLNLQATASLLLLVSVITVSIAGHYGAKLVHIYGVGPKGDYLSKEHIGIHIPLLGDWLR